MTILRITAAAVAAAAVLSAAGCGGESGGKAGSSASAKASAFAGKTPMQILDEVRAAMRGAGSLRIAGIMVDEKEHLEFDIVTTSSDAKGTMTLPIEGKRTEMEVVKKGSKIFVKSRDLWTNVGGAAMAARFGDRWIVGNRDLEQGIQQFFSVQGWTEILKPDGEVTRKADTVIDGRPAVTLSDGSGGLLYIAATGKPLPVRLTGTSTDAGSAGDIGELNFTFDVPVQVAVPPNPLDFGSIRSA